MNSGVSMRFQYTCIVDTPYALALYLLKMSRMAIGQTLFCIGNNLSDDILRALPHARRFYIDGRKSRFLRMIFRMRCWLYHLAHIRGTQIYGQDHINCAAQLICRQKYTLIEDGPGTCLLNRERPGHQFPDTRNPFCLLAFYALGGTIYLKTMGRNPQCINRWVTSQEDVRLFEKERVPFEVLDVRKLWEGASEEKKKMVLRVIDGRIGGLDVSALSKTNETVLLTQPMIEDCGLTEDEIEAVYRPFIDRYAQSGVVIKPHPRDKFDYENRFPNCRVLRTRIPMQLLNAFGLNFKRAITICSSSVSDMSEDMELVWLGAEIHPKIAKVYGHPSPPSKFKNIILGC